MYAQIKYHTLRSLSPPLHKSRSSDILRSACRDRPFSSYQPLWYQHSSLCPLYTFAPTSFKWFVHSLVSSATAFFETRTTSPAATPSAKSASTTPWPVTTRAPRAWSQRGRKTPSRRRSRWGRCCVPPKNPQSLCSQHSEGGFVYACNDSVGQNRLARGSRCCLVSGADGGEFRLNGKAVSSLSWNLWLLDSRLRIVATV